MDLIEPHLTRALEAVRGRPPLGPDSVHHFRRELRRARAGLRLVREAVARNAYAEENFRLRDAARVLSNLRDADVAVETIDGLIERRKMREHAEWLRRQRIELRNDAIAMRNLMPQTLAAELEQAVIQSRERVSAWRLPHDPWPVLSEGLRRIFARGRKAFAAVRGQHNDRTLHELRKQVKHLSSALKILDAFGQARAGRLAKEVDEIAERLGKDLDLAALRRNFGSAESALLARIARRRARLQERALKAARKLFKAKPRKFVSRLLGGWA